MEKIKLTKLSGGKSHDSSLVIGQSLIGGVESDSLFPKEPTVGRPFVISVEIPKQIAYYRTSIVEEICPDGTFKTSNSTYKIEKY